MVLETAVGVFVPWLWQKVADAAKSHDDAAAIENALKDAIQNGFEHFANKHKELAASLLDQHFLENHAGPELAKYLTRNKAPDVSVIAAAYRTQIGLSCPANIEESITDLLNFVMEAMKDQPALQSFIDERQVEETYLAIREVKADASLAVDLLEQQAQTYIEDQTRQGKIQIDLLNGQTKVEAGIAAILAKLDSNSAPQSSGHEINKLLAKQLDMARDKIRSGLFKEAREILDTHSDEIATSDDFTKFRWHTNLATCLFVDGQEEAAANEYLKAFDYAPEDEKALANRARAFHIKRLFNESLTACEAGIARYPTSPILWALKIASCFLLGQNEPEEGLPESLRNDGDILYTLSYIRQKQGRQQEAYEFARRCYEKDTKSLETKRALLASALIWATVDPVIAHFGQISSEQKQALHGAISAFEPVEAELESIQPEKASFEVTNNIAISLNLTGDTDRSCRIALRGLQRFPLADGLLRIRINELVDKGDISAVRVLTGSLINELSTGILVILAEAYANSGELACYENIKSVLDTRNVDEQIAEDLLALSIHALWVAGNQTTAIERAKAQLETAPANIPLATLFARMLRKQRNILESENQARQCLAAVTEATLPPTILQVADLLYDFRLYLEASDLYGRLADTHVWGSLTQRYLICLVESDQRERARLAIESLPASAHELSSFRRIAANLARAAGDLPRLYDILKHEVETTPLDSGVAVGYVGVLRQLEKVEELKAFLATNPVFGNGSPENEFEFSKYETNYGFAHQGIMRLYRLFRAHPQDARIAGFYLLVLLLAKNIDMFQIGDAASSGVAVQLRYPNDMRWIAVEYPGLSKLSTWPEVVPPDSLQAGCVVGKKLGEKTEIDSGIGKVVAEVVQIESILLFASRKAHEVIAASTGPSGPLWSVNLGKPDGGLDVEPILESLRRRSKYAESLFAQYSKQQFPISVLADALGSDPVTLLLEWPFKHARFYVCGGTHLEREQSRELVRKEGVRYVLDLVTLAELARCNVFEKTIKLIGTPLIPQTLKEQLLGLIQLVDAPQASSNMREENGQFYMTDIPAKYYEHRKQFLHKLLDYVNKYCEVVPTFGPVTVTNDQRLLARLLDNASIDAIYLALERKAILLSEDGALRFLATQAGVTDTLWLQPLLMHLRDTALLKQAEYSRIIIEKLSLGHDFVSVGSDDLIWAAKKNTSALSPQVKSVLETFKHPTLELRSGMHVCAGFLRVVAEEFQIQLVKTYYKECCDALCYGREDVADDITKVMRTVMLRVLALIEQKASSKSRQEFMYALAEEEVDILFRPKKIVLAIQSIFR